MTNERWMEKKKFLMFGFPSSIKFSCGIFFLCCLCFYLIYYFSKDIYCSNTLQGTSILVLKKDVLLNRVCIGLLWRKQNWNFFNPQWFYIKSIMQITKSLRKKNNASIGSTDKNAHSNSRFCSLLLSLIERSCMT